MLGVSKKVIPQGRPQMGHVIPMEEVITEKSELHKGEQGQSVKKSETFQRNSERTLDRSLERTLDRSPKRRLERTLDRSFDRQPEREQERRIDRSSGRVSDRDLYQSSRLSRQSKGSSEQYENLMEQIDELRQKVERFQKLAGEKDKEAQDQQEQIDMCTKQFEELSYILDEQMEQLEEQMNQMFHEFDEKIGYIQKDIGDGFDALQINLVKGIHKEIVGSSQNIEDSVQTIESRIGRLANQKTVKKINTATIVTLILSVLNTAGMVFVVLVLTGVLRF